MTTTITGIEIKDTIIHGNLIISGVTIQTPRKLPPLWVNVPYNWPRNLDRALT